MKILRRSDYARTDLLRLENELFGWSSFWETLKIAEF